MTRLERIRLPHPHFIVDAGHELRALIDPGTQQRERGVRQRIALPRHLVFAAEPEKFALTVQLLRITFPYIVFISLVALAADILNTWNRFSVPALTPALLNVSFIVGALFFAPYFDPPVLVLAWAVFAGGLSSKGVKVLVGGTLSANPLSCAAGYHSLLEMERTGAPALAGRAGDRLRAGLDALVGAPLPAHGLSAGGPDDRASIWSRANRARRRRFERHGARL